MTAQERCDAYRVKFPAKKNQHSRPDWPYVVREDKRDVIYATWVIGNDYRNKSSYYGAYPKSYLARVAALFPDVEAETKAIIDSVPIGYWLTENPPPQDWPMLHAFSGSLEPGPYTRLNLNVVETKNGPVAPDVLGSVYDCAQLFGGHRFSLALADPTYSAADAVKYGTPMVHRLKATNGLAAAVKPGGHLVWLDQAWPIHSKTKWVTVGRISLWRSTNHRIRGVSIFQRVP